MYKKIWLVRIKSGICTRGHFENAFQIEGNTLTWRFILLQGITTAANAVYNKSFLRTLSADWVYLELTGIDNTIHYGIYFEVFIKQKSVVLCF